MSTTPQKGIVSRCFAGMRGRWLGTSALLGGILCLAITILMNRHAGSIMGATDEGKVLLSTGSIAIEIVGVCILGLIVGRLMRGPWKGNVGRKLVALPLSVVVLASALFCIWNLANFMAIERLSVTKAAEARDKALHEAAEQRRREAAQRQAAAEAAAQARLKAQQDLAKTQLGFMQAELKDSKGRDRRVLRKDFAGEAAKIIAEVGKGEAPAAAGAEPAQSAPEPAIVIVRADSGNEMIADLTGLETKALMATYLATFAILLIVLETVMFPAASFFWGEVAAAPLRRPEGGHGEAPSPAPLAPVLPLVALAPAVTPPLALPGPSPTEPPAGTRTDPRAPAVAAPAPEPPQPPANPFLAKPIPGSEAELRALGFPVDGRPAGELRPKLPPKDAAFRFMRALQAWGYVERPIWLDEMFALYEAFAHADHREASRWNEVEDALRNMRSKGVDFGKRRDPKETDPKKRENKRSGYVIERRTWRRPKPADEKPANDAAPGEVGKAEKRPFGGSWPAAANDAAPMAAQAMVMRSLKLPPPRAPHLVTHGERLAIAQARAMKAIERGMSRKQRGARVNRMARAA